MKKPSLFVTPSCGRFTVNLLLAGLLLSCVFVSPARQPGNQFFLKHERRQALIDLPSSGVRHSALTNSNGQRLRVDLNKQSRTRHSLTDNAAPPTDFSAPAAIVSQRVGAVAQSFAYRSIRSSRLGGRAPPVSV